MKIQRAWLWVLAVPILVAAFQLYVRYFTIVDALFRSNGTEYYCEITDHFNTPLLLYVSYDVFYPNILMSPRLLLDVRMTTKITHSNGESIYPVLASIRPTVSDFKRSKDTKSELNINASTEEIWFANTDYLDIPLPSETDIRRILTNAGIFASFTIKGRVADRYWEVSTDSIQEFSIADIEDCHPI